MMFIGYFHIFDISYSAEHHNIAIFKNALLHRFFPSSLSRKTDWHLNLWNILDEDETIAFPFILLRGLSYLISCNHPLSTTLFLFIIYQKGRLMALNESKKEGCCLCIIHIIFVIYFFHSIRLFINA